MVLRQTASGGLETDGTCGREADVMNALQSAGSSPRALNDEYMKLPARGIIMRKASSTVI